MTTNTMKFPLVVLLLQERANLTAGESSMSHAGAAPQEVAETDWLIGGRQGPVGSWKAD